jgi:hypothetical protein
MDLHAKLEPWGGFLIGAIVDGKSKAVLRMWVSITKSSLCVCRQWLAMVRDFGYPHLLRVDRGKENILAVFDQIANGGRVSAGRSVYNTRVEGLWAKFRPGMVDHYISIISQLVHNANLNLQSPIARGAVQRTFLAPVQRACDTFVTVWNGRRKRKSGLTPGAAFVEMLPPGHQIPEHVSSTTAELVQDRYNRNGGTTDPEDECEIPYDPLSSEQRAGLELEQQLRFGPRMSDNWLAQLATICLYDLERTLQLMAASPPLGLPPPNE